MAKKQMSPIKVMLLLVVIAFVGVLVGFFDPVWLTKINEIIKAATLILRDRKTEGTP